MMLMTAVLMLSMDPAIGDRVFSAISGDRVVGLSGAGEASPRIPASERCSGA